MSGTSSLLPLDGYADARERPPPVPLLDEAHAALTELLDTLRAEYWQRHAVEMHCRRQFHLSPAQASTLMRACPNSVTLEGGAIWCSREAAKAWPGFLASVLAVLPPAENGQGMTMEDVIVKMPGWHSESLVTALWWLCDCSGQAWCVERREPWQRRTRQQGPKPGGWRWWAVYVKAPT